jgi:protein SCO1/2
MMKKFGGFWFLVALSFVVLPVLYFLMRTHKTLPIYNPYQIDASLVDSAVQSIQKSHTIADFSLFNQNGDTVSGQIVQNKVYVAEFFFATCQDICPLMNAQMQRIFQKFKTENDFAILSFSVQPERDTPSALSAYALKYGATLPTWQFLTGGKPQIYTLARQSYFLMKKESVGEGAGDKYDFIHTNFFVLIDRQKRIRGYYDGTNKKQVDILMQDIALLLAEK